MPAQLFCRAKMGTLYGEVAERADIDTSTIWFFQQSYRSGIGFSAALFMRQFESVRRPSDKKAPQAHPQNSRRMTEPWANRLKRFFPVRKKAGMAALPYFAQQRGNLSEAAGSTEGMLHLGPSAAYLRRPSAVQSVPLRSCMRGRRRNRHTTARSFTRACACLQETCTCFKKLSARSGEKGKRSARAVMSPDSTGY